MSFWTRFAIGGLCLLCVAGQALAQADVNELEPSTDCPISILSCESDLQEYVSSRLFDSSLIFYAFGAVLFACLVISGFQLAFFSRSDSATDEIIKAYGEAFIGTILVSGAFALADVFVNIGDPQVIDLQVFERTFVQQLIAFGVQITGVVLVANIVVQAARLITAQEEGDVSTARTNFIQSLIGGAIVMLAAPVISLVIPGTFNAQINVEIVGIANFLATLFGTFCVISFVVAGIMLIFAYDDGLKDTARTIVITSIVALIVVVSAAAIVNFLLPIA